MRHDNLKYIPFFFLLIILSGSVISCNHHGNVQLLQQADALIDEYPDSALQLLNQIVIPQELSQAERALHALLMGSAHRKTHRSLCEDSLLPDALAYYEHQQDTPRMQTGYLSGGYYFYANGQRKKADSLFNKGLQLARLRHDKQEMIKMYRGLIAVNINHNVVFDYPKIQNYMRACMELDPTPEHIFYYGAMLAFTDNDSIHYYAPTAIRMAEKINDPYTWNYLLNYSSYLIKKKRYKEALQWMQRTDFSQINDMYKKRCYLHIARCHVFLSQPDEAQRWLNRADSLPIRKDLTTENERIYLQGIIDYIRYKHADMTYLFRFNDSILVSIHDKNDALLAKNEAKNKLKQQNLLLQLKSERIFSGASCLIFLIIAGALYINYRRKRALLCLQQQLAENRITLMKLQTRTEEEKQPSPLHEEQLIHALRLQKIELCKKTFAKTAWSKRLAALNCSADTLELSGQESSELTDTLNQCFIDVLIDLKQDSPKLNSAELTHIVFLLLGCSNRIISLCTFAAESTIRTRKIRIKEKLSKDYQSILFE